MVWVSMGPCYTDVISSMGILPTSRTHSLVYFHERRGDICNFCLKRGVPNREGPCWSEGLIDLLRYLV